MFGTYVRIEFHLILRYFLFGNLETALWLRRICYDRIRKGRTLGVFVLSALWVRK